jgi:hypothetical protein
MSTLDDFDVDPETKQALRVALERTRMSLGLTDDHRRNTAHPLRRGPSPHVRARA